MNYYLAEEASIKAFCNLDLIDYIFATPSSPGRKFEIIESGHGSISESKWTGMQVEGKEGLKLFYYSISNSYQTYGYDIVAIHLDNILLLRKLTLAYRLVLMR